MEESRRTFLWKSGAWGTALAASAWPARSHGFLANETINVGIIGYGGRCRALVKELSRIPGTRITAVCDVFDPNLRAAHDLTNRQGFATKDHRALLNRSDVDAVIVATPDHWHVPITIDACNAGKDVYVEKPLTHNLQEGQSVIDAEQKNKRIVQVGMQQRSMPHLQEAFEIIKSGELGHVYKVHLTWNRNNPRGRTDIWIEERLVDWTRFVGNAPSQRFNAFRMTQWRWFWDFGGGLLTDLMVHWMDVVNWYLDLDKPAMAVTIGDQFERSLWETPDSIQTLVRYPDQKLQVYFEGTFVNHRNRAMAEFMGEKGTLYIDRGRYEFHPENDMGSYREKVIGSGGRGLDFYDKPEAELLHLTNWVDCIRSREVPRCPATVGVKAVYAAHLGNLAYRTGGVAHWGS